MTDLFELSEESELIQTLNDKNETIILYFSASWCKPCKRIYPNMVTLSNTYNDKIFVVKIDVDEFEELSSKFNVSCLPTFVFINNSKEIHRIVGDDFKSIQDKVQEIILGV